MVFPIVNTILALGPMFSNAVNSMVNHFSGKEIRKTQAQTSEAIVQVTKERDQNQFQIEQARMALQDMHHQRSLALQEQQNILTRESQERQAELNRQAQNELMRLNQAFQSQENCLNREHSEKLAQLNRDFQANEGKLSREHLERLEIFRSDVQKFLFESQKQHQLELKQMDIKLAWELRRFDRETAVVNMREQKILNESPIWEAAKIILNTHENSDVLPLHVFLSPPNLKYDERQNNTLVRGLPEMEQYLNGRIRDFFTAYSAQQRPINYLGASAWTSKMFRAEAATRSIFNCLKSEPTLIIESAVEGEEFELNFAYWGLGYVEPRYYNALRFSWCELLYGFAKKRTLEWFNRREAEGEPESSWIADYGEETVQKYKHNLAIIQREEKCIARGDDLQDIARNYHIQSKDSEALKNHISICHCLFAGLLD